MPLHVSSTRAHRQETKIVLYSLWYHHTETSKWSKITKITKIQFYKSLQYKPKGRRNIGRRRKRWRDQLHLEDQGTG